MNENNISILVPCKPDNGQRDKNWAWLEKRYKTLMPKAEICKGYDDGELFCKSAAVNKAAKKSTRDIFIILDNDIAFDMALIDIGIKMLNEYPWVIPYTEKVLLDDDNTNRLLSMNPSVTMSESKFTSTIIEKNGYGAICIVPRKNFEKLKGFDEGFKGWGGEDSAFYIAMNTLCGKLGRPENMPIWHLNHPRQPPRPRANLELYNKYKEARGNRDAIQKLINRKENISK